jgi:gamma-glutamyltranspeptidase
MPPHRHAYRPVVMGRRGAVASAHPTASLAGIRVLLEGGNAVDAAVAAAAVLNLTEPMMAGVGGDLFAIIYIAKEKEFYVLNASGIAPSGATVERFHSLGYAADPANWGPGSGMPVFGILPVTIPGAAWGWEEVLKRFGKLGFKEVLQPAIDYAENGSPLMTITLMGGDIQAQGHAQALVNIFDLGANLQAASDMARFHHAQVPNRLELESPLYTLVGEQLAGMGHKVVSIDGAPVGGLQSILMMPPSDAGAPHGIYRAGSDHRKDGEAVGW